MNRKRSIRVVAGLAFWLLAAPPLVAEVETTHSGEWNAGQALAAEPADAREPDHQKAQWMAVHFKPLSLQVSDEVCLACHQDILERKPRDESPAGVKAGETLAWYQTLGTYQGDQETFHRRHLATPLATKLMNLRCNTCHEGQNPREETPVPPTGQDAGFTMRKMVNPETSCLKCHGQSDYKIMGLPGPWEKTRDMMGNNCLSCHAAIRTHRHQVTYLNAEAIEQAGQQDSDVCFGCHGGRDWYRISYPYPRHPWPGMAPTTPDWAKDRPTQSEARFRK